MRRKRAFLYINMLSNMLQFNCCVRKGKLSQTDSFVDCSNTRFVQENGRCENGATWFRATARAGEWCGRFRCACDFIRDVATTPTYSPLVTSHLCLPTILLPAVGGLIRRVENGVLLYGMAKVV